MAMKFVAPVIAQALLVIASSVGKPPEEKSLLSRRKTRASLYLQKKNRRPVLNHARCQTFQKRKVVVHELRSFL